MSGYTRLSCLVWEWHRLNQLAPTARLFWFALYTSPHGKRGVPALWHGSVVTMAEAARLPLDEAARSLDTLIDHDLAEYDPRSLVLRLTELPDAGEWPSNPCILEGWYKRFRMVPECGVRDAHVATIRWMLERGALEAAKNAGGRPSLKHEQVWASTFGTVQIPAARRRGVRRFADNNDTSTDVQPSLFRPSPELPRSDTESGSVDNSGSLRQSNKITVRETLSRGSGEGEGEGEGDLLLDSGSGGTAHAARRVLTLVPSPAFDAEDLAEDLATATAGRFPRLLTKTQRLALQRAIDTSGSALADPSVRAALREYVQRGTPGLDPPAEQQTPQERAIRSRGISPELVASPGWLALAIQRAVEWATEAAEKIAFAAECRRQLGHE